MAMATLTVSGIKCRNLLGVDKGGTSDPYVEVIVGKEKQKTSTIKKELNPTFSEVFVFGKKIVRTCGVA